MRTLITLLFISFTSFGQTYDDIMSIDGLNTFKKVVIENSYQLDKETTDDDKVSYNNIDDTRGAMHSTSGYPIFIFYFSKTSIIGDMEISDTPYDEIYEQVKKKCEFVRIQTMNSSDYACYECEDAKFNGLIGFTMLEGSGVIQQIIMDE